MTVVMSCVGAGVGGGAGAGVGAGVGAGAWHEILKLNDVSDAPGSEDLAGTHAFL